MTAAAPDRWVLLCGRSGGGTDALRQYADALCAALGADGGPCEVRDVPAPRQRADGDRRVEDVIGPADGVLVVQYNPFSYGHLGVAPGLVRGLRGIRRTYPGLRVALMCHETIVLSPGAKWRALRQVHRLQLAALIRLADHVFVSTGRWLPELRRLGAPAATRLPVGSNLPDRRDERAAVRRRLGVADDDLVVASFSTGHPAHRDDVLIAALDAVLAARPDTTVLTLGAGRTPLLDPAGPQRELAPGQLPAAEVSGLLAAADIFLSPYVDGVSTRRGTVMAALQHAVAVVATVGEATDPDLAAHVGRWGVPVQDGASAFAQAAVALAADDAARATHAAAGRALYAAAYDWPVIARELDSTVGGAA